MPLFVKVQSFLRNLFLSRRVEVDLDQEVHSHLEMLVEEKIRAGLAPEAAQRAARIELGGIEQVKEQVRREQIGNWIQSVASDCRYGLRQLYRNRGFTVTAVATLGLGIGATTGIFSAVYSLLLRPLPYYEARQLVYVSSAWPKAQAETLISPDFVAAQSETKSFEQFAGYYYGDDNLTGAGDPVQVRRVAVTANFFSSLGVVPQLGRNFSVDEDRSGGPLAILLSDHLWRNQFGADPGVVGKDVTLNGKEHTIIGVLPPYFSFPDLEAEPDLYVPAALERDTTLSIAKSVWPIHVIARLRQGVSIEQAQAELQAYFQVRARSYPPVFAPFADGRRMIVEPLQRHLVGEDGRPLYILLVSVAAVLMIACANIANLQMARAVSRRHETALRAALGASRLRLIRQFLVESLILSSLAAVLGLSIAFVVTSLIRHVDGPHVSPYSRATQLLRLPFSKLSAVIQIDGWVLVFTVGLALLTTMLFGLVPAISGTRTDPRNALQTATLRVSSGLEQRLMRHALLVLEVGMAVVLLACAGLLVRSFVNVLRYDLGFDPSNTLTGVTLLHSERYASGGPHPEFCGSVIASTKCAPRHRGGGCHQRASAGANRTEQQYHL